jgi:hypothetical protein
VTVLLRSEWKQNRHFNGALARYFEVRPVTVLMWPTPVGAKILMGDTDVEAATLCYVTACFGDALPIYTEPGTRSRLATQLIHTRPTAWCQVPTIPEKTIFEFKELFS